jgi:hypothetical protein
MRNRPMDLQADPDLRQSTLIAWIAGIVVLLIVAALAIPGLFASGRVSNDRSAWSRLKSLTSAEADFRANDRDWNHVNDYWTGDVKSLYTLTSSAIQGVGGEPDDPPIKLIERALAAADADGQRIDAGGENGDLASTTVPSPRDGYWYAALSLDLSAPNGAESIYQVDTGGRPPMGSCHNLSKFGFVSFPDSQSTGPYVYIVNQNNTVFRRSTTGSLRTGDSIPPGLNGIAPEYRNWPKDADLKSWWSPVP